MIKRKIKDKVEGGNVKGKQYTLAELEEIASTKINPST